MTFELTGRVIKVAAPVRDQAAAMLRAAIQTGELPAGTPLIERELCESLDISRSSLREAMRTLEAESLIEIRPHRSPVVATLSPETRRELYEVREALEGEGIRLFTQRASDEDVDRLEIIALALADAIERGDAKALFETKSQFYDVVFDGARNKELRHLAEVAYSRLAPLRVFTLTVPGRRAASGREVTAAIASVRARNADAAETLWRKHVRGAAEAAEQLASDGALPSAIPE